MIKIDGQRENYRPAGLRSAVLYFVLNDLVAIDPMYQSVGSTEKHISSMIFQLNNPLTSLTDNMYIIYKYKVSLPYASVPKHFSSR